MYIYIIQYDSVVLMAWVASAVSNKQVVSCEGYRIEVLPKLVELYILWSMSIACNLLFSEDHDSHGV